MSGVVNVSAAARPARIDVRVPEVEVPQVDLVDQKLPGDLAYNARLIAGGCSASGRASRGWAAPREARRRKERDMAELSLQQATTIVEAALGKARETSCAPLAVAVLDGGGHLKAFAREDGAGIIRPQIATGKAWGALGMGVGSRTLARRVAEQPQQQAFFSALNAMSQGRVVPAAGGVLIRDAGGVIGAVGISGDVSDKDEACALAGIAAARLVDDTG